MRSRSHALAALVLVGGFSACAQGDGGPGGPGGSSSAPASASSSTGHPASSSSSSSSTTSTTATGTGGTSGPGGFGGAGAAGGFGGAGATGTGAFGGFGGFGGSDGPGCVSPIIATVPSGVMGDTTGKPNDGDGSCQQGGSGDVVYQVDIAADAILQLDLDTTAHLGIHVRYFCDDPFEELGCADNGTAGPQTLSLSVFQGDELFVFVDGNGPADHGPYTLTLKTHPAVCGDGIISGNESCDPPDGVYCGPNCQPEPEICNDGNDNDGNGLTDCEDPACAADPGCPIATLCSAAPVALPTNMGNTSGGTKVFAGSCTGSGANEVVYTYNPPKPGILSLKLDSAADLGLYVRTKCEDGTTELGCSDMVGGGMTETLAVPVTGGTSVSVFVDGAFSAEMGPFTLATSFLSFTEVEPNDAHATATPYIDPFIGAINPETDNDYVSITVPGPSSKLTAQVDDIGNGDCANFNIDSEVEIYATNGTTSLMYNDDNATDLCSLATATGLAAGTYYVRVAASQVSLSTFLYRLKLTVQ